MSSLKCPRCKNKIDSTDTFCKNCGAPIKSEVDKNKKSKVVTNEVSEKKEEVKIESLEKTPTFSSQKKNQSWVIILILGIIIFILTIALIYLLCFKKEKEVEKCVSKEPEVQYIEKEPTIQYINFRGYRFSMPLDWNFEGDGLEYQWINQKENIYVSLKEQDDVDYETFASAEYQKVFLEKLQTEQDFTMSHREERIKDDFHYYIIEGTFESYRCMIVVTKSARGIFVTQAQFENNSVYTDYKQTVIDFAISYQKNDKM